MEHHVSSVDIIFTTGSAGIISLGRLQLCFHKNLKIRKLLEQLNPICLKLEFENFVTAFLQGLDY